MKTVVNSAPKQEIKFPCLMRSEIGIIALFNSPTSGIVLDVGPTGGEPGYYAVSWTPKCWTPLLPGESVTLIQE